MDHVHIGWPIFQQDCSQLAQKIRENMGRPQIIVAITRGGLVGATILAHELNVRAIDTMDIRSYADDHTQQDVRLVRPCALETQETGGRNVVIVDDLIDSGKTLALAKQRLPHAKIAVAYARRHMDQHVDFYARLIPQDTWVVFPWES